MTLIVEDGTGLPNAESYETVAGFRAYAGNVGFDLSAYGDDAKIEHALRRATTWLDARYGSRFLGTWTTSSQALQWPRTGVTYRETTIPSHSVPERLKRATCEVAWRELQVPSSLSPDAAPDRIKRDRVGDVETEFAMGPAGAGIALPVVDDLLDGLTKGRAGAYVGRAVRS